MITLYKDEIKKAKKISQKEIKSVDKYLNLRYISVTRVTKDLKNKRGGEWMTNKKRLQKKHLKPKSELRRERLGRELTTGYMANLIGLDRRQYEKKEAGEYPFKDYEMDIIAREFDKSVEDIFFK